MLRVAALTLSLVILMVLYTPLPAWAHQPFFEDKDIVANAPWKISDPTVSTVVYATLDSQQDVDYFTFDGKAGERILLEITIPQITGQETFAPSMALIGPGLPAANLPVRVARAAGVGALEIPAAQGPARSFYEPFSRTSYWERQSQRVTLPQSGRYVVAVWRDQGQVGRYGFVIGDKEQLGGELIGLGKKLRAYWTPVPEPAGATADPVRGDVRSRSASKSSTPCAQK